MAKRSVTVLALVWLVVIVAVISSAVTLSVAGPVSASTGEYEVSRAEYDMIERYSRLETIRQTMLTEYYQPLDDDALTGRETETTGDTVHLAETALDALVGVDDVLAVAFADRFLRAFGRTSAAADAFVRNFVCHYSNTSLLLIIA